ncbi:hypothetical protein ACWT_0530 [Actinoplanes sp. SE50]|uniref:hypothetical protein n=1 Tax=unclassified Actinoplanes TaxID=2626549 RepID=UPI00023ECBFE|nr:MULTISPECIES: hypothetical protein [unclassified Actinoplanes]AEV81543.1 hypothetical protein ACPL_646 [Actinoplanes sp. SE50/110]ATO79945.1 hypothetical protein ACWT_0530 [Actinoplanes sp. SE50]SLL97347.1 hypothetical protein ACSP50_0548 [Actinoplanes sp. SE50/110]
MSDSFAVSRAPLTAPAADTKWYEGAGILEAVAGAADGFSQGDFLTGFGNSVVAGMSALGAVLDPFQAVFAAGVGWLMEHLNCLREPLDWLAGDPKEIEGHAATWRNVRDQVNAAVNFFAAQVTAATAPWEAQAVHEYRAKAAGIADGVRALGVVSGAVADATLAAGAMVGVVRNTVRDLIAEVVGAAISKALQALLVVTIPEVLTSVAMMVAECSAKIVRVLRRLSADMVRLGMKFPQLERLCAFLRGFLDKVASDISMPAVLLNSAKVNADTYPADSSGSWGGWKEAYRTFGDADDAVYGTKIEIASDAIREALKGNSIQNGGATGDAMIGDAETSPDVDMPR